MDSNTKTIFWCREVFRQLGARSLEEFKTKFKQGGALENLLKDKDDELGGLSFRLFSSNSLKTWRDYYDGSSCPHAQKSGKYKNNRNLTLVDELLPGTETYFTNGPSNIFEIMETAKFEDAVDTLLSALENIWRKYRPIHYQYNPELAETYSYNEVRPLLGTSPDQVFGHINKFDPKDLANPLEVGNDGIEELYFYKFGVLYIEAKYNRRLEALHDFLFFDTESFEGPGYLELIRDSYNIPISSWLKEPTIDESRQIFIRTYKEVLPKQVEIFSI